MDIASLESIAIEMHQRNGFDPAQPVSPLRLARKQHGADVIVRPPTMLGDRPAATGWLKGAPRIMLRRTIPDELLGFFCAHELSHLELGIAHCNDAEIEDECDYLGAAIMAPRPAAFALHREFGWNLSKIAGAVVSTQTWAALRLSETQRVPLAAISPERVRVRGPEEWVWGDELAVRAMTRKRTPGVTKIRVTDRPRREILLAANDG